MKTLNEIKTLIRRHQDILSEKYGIAVVGVFGSYARGEQKEDSDLDLLAEEVRPISLLELVGAQIYLGEVLGVKVDLGLKESVRAELRDVILGDAVAP